MIKIAEFELLKFSYDNVIEETNYFLETKKLKNQKLVLLRFLGFSKKPRFFKCDFYSPGPVRSGAVNSHTDRCRPQYCVPVSCRRKAAV